jgi:phosphoserine phosphatase
MEMISRPRRLWLGYSEVFLDCDSTLTGTEGIVELARLKGMEKAVEQLTQQAMEGTLPLEEIYGERLRMLRPTREDLAEVVLAYRERTVPDARELIAALRFLRIGVHIISGGLAEPVRAFGGWLGVPADRIHAVGLEFDQLAGRWWEYSQPRANPAERYLDFVPGPLAESRGKAELINKVRQHPGRAMLVGDGVSDLWARSAVELFVGFGGVAYRERVASESDIYVATDSLAALLPLAASVEAYGQCQGTPHQALFEKGLALIFEGAVTFHHQERKESFYASYQAVHPRPNGSAA